MLRQDHFEGGANLNRGQRKKSDPILSELFPVALEGAVSVGGSATESVAVTNLLATDVVLSMAQKTAGAGLGKTLIGWANIATGQIDLTWDADPGAGAVVIILVARRAAT